MKSKIVNVIIFLLGLGLIFLFCYYLYKVIHWAFTTLNEQVLAAFIAGIFTVLVTALSLVLTKRYEFNKQIKEQHQLKKVPIYEEFLEFWFKILLSSTTGKKITDKDMMIFISEFTQKLILWGSDDVIKEYGNFRDYFKTVGGENRVTSFDSLKRFENLLLAIRKDAGHRNKDINQLDLLRLFINDIDKYKPNK
ncbi:hypothetical protein [Heyndrickxia oleronia]|uniref:hypothetical protein n=1 Tax=Heyndrickxia oleronia TaxID=38875 RepID=UPI001B08719D|nr:hypothetical protein [Heyndrickxia oleronia]GIN38467.1 hypothetical protein J19TS1_14160 [Heyndrickxia oleronia]